MKRFSFTGHLTQQEVVDLITRLSADGLTVVTNDLGRGKWRIYGFTENVPTGN